MCCQKELLLSVTFPLPLTNRNDGQGHSWHRTAEARADIELLIASEGLNRQHPFDVPVTIALTRILGKGDRLWDADSGLRGNAKQLIDSLVAASWFVDDGPKYIKEVRFFQCSENRALGPAVKIAVRRF